MLIFIGIVLYSNSFQNKMFWDDNDYILNNQYIKDWKYIPNYFSENIIAGAGLMSNYWRPMSLMAFSLEWHLWGNWAPGYHIVNTLFHVANAILIFFILSRLVKSFWLSILPSLIFLIHPLQTEAVTYAAGLVDPLAVFFMFLGIIFYLKFRDSGASAIKSIPYFLTILMFILAIMAKEIGFMLPAFLFIIDLIFLDQKLSIKERLKKILKIIWPFIILAGAYVLLRATALNFINTFNFYRDGGLFATNMGVRLLTFFKILTVYFGLLFWPIGLHMERSIELATSPFSLQVIFGGTIFIGLIILAITQIKRHPILSFGIFWFFIGLAPTSNILIPINGLLYEHWLYHSLIGIFLIFIWLGKIAAEKFGIQKIVLVWLSIFIAFLSVLTINRNKDWRDPIVFYNQILKYSPTSYRVTNNLGMVYAENKKYEDAERTYKKAIALNPSGYVAYHNLGNLYLTMGKDNLAEENYKSAINLNQNFVYPYFNLINIYLKNKDYKNALIYLEKIRTIYPDNKEILSAIEEINRGLEK
ncbi:MAG: tetratricopeptide repeat protein [Candidatus Pacebacteria bacterium]|nr:tetratricopeptide repeat protein [Candidatus Paceibacterota bacterium]